MDTAGSLAAVLGIPLLHEVHNSSATSTPSCRCNSTLLAGLKLLSDYEDCRRTPWSSEPGSAEAAPLKALSPISEQKHVEIANSCPALAIAGSNPFTKCYQSPMELGWQARQLAARFHCIAQGIQCGATSKNTRIQSSLVRFAHSASQTRRT